MGRCKKKKKRAGSFRSKLLFLLILGCLGYYAWMHPESVKQRAGRFLSPVLRTVRDKVSLVIRRIKGENTVADAAEPLKKYPASGQPVITQDSPYDNLALGVPGKADTIVDRPGYALGYIEYHEQAAWVVYRLTREEVLIKEAGRTNKFMEDPEIPTGSASLSDYRQSDYDRGHLAPAADMAFSLRTMSDSFYMSNMSPQKPGFNRRIWKDLEEQIRYFAVEERDIYVVTGPVLPETKTITIGDNKVTVPKYYYKVIYDRTPPEKMIGFILPNEESSRPLQDFAVTVDAVEQTVGLNFFSTVPQPKQEQLESTLSVQDWKWKK